MGFPRAETSVELMDFLCVSPTSVVGIVRKGLP